MYTHARTHSRIFIGHISSVHLDSSTHSLLLLCYSSRPPFLSVRSTTRAPDLSLIHSLPLSLALHAVTVVTRSQRSVLLVLGRVHVPSRNPSPTSRYRAHTCIHNDRMSLYVPQRLFTYPVSFATHTTPMHQVAPCPSPSSSWPALRLALDLAH